MPLKAEFISSLFQEIKAYQIEARWVASADRSKRLLPTSRRARTVLTNFDRFTDAVGPSPVELK
jgi:hypothetical protein